MTGPSRLVEGPFALLGDARRLLAGAPAGASALWARAAVVLTRQGLEGGLAHLWARKAPGLEEAPFTAQLLCLHEILGDDDLAAEVAWTWHALSRATHHHAEPLPPGASELAGWIATVDRLLARIG